MHSGDRRPAVSGNGWSCGWVRWDAHSVARPVVVVAATGVGSSDGSDEQSGGRVAVVLGHGAASC